MSLKTALFAIFLAIFFFSLILFVIFGQTTVRKLRKNPATKEELGFEFISGLDILNVAGALALPRWLNRKLRSTPLAGMYANAELLDKFTNKFDRILATIFYVLVSSSLLAIILLILLDEMGVFTN